MDVGDDVIAHPLASSFAARDGQPAPPLVPLLYLFEQARAEEQGTRSLH